MLEGKVAVITGSARGIGRYVARTFVEAGASVVLADVEPLDVVTNELTAIEGQVLPVPTNVRREEEVQALMEAAVERFGHIDILVNNAAIVTHFQWGVTRWPVVKDMDTAFWDSVMETNLRGTFLCTKYAIPYMEAQGAGHIISTMGGGNPASIGSCAYAVSKDAIKTMTRFVAEEEREANVCVVMITPGTQIATEVAPDEARQRMAGPEFVGQRFVLAAQAGMELSGQVLDLVDGKLGPRA
jgi:NAD(P)-dependent dehydrogenase (short-subunit alcohol dehydrogenase family)